MRKTVKNKKNKTPARRAITVCRSIDYKGIHVSTEYHIQSPALCSVLLEINDGVEELDLIGLQPEVRTIA